jgi:hypothetical protein
MGAKTWIVTQSNRNPRERLASRPPLDNVATTSLVASVFPDRTFDAPLSADLSFTSPSEGTVVAGSFGELNILISNEFAIDRPSELRPTFIAAEGLTVLHASLSVVDWFALAIWKDGQLQRSLSVAPDSGVIEDLGERLAFELPYWEGEHPAVDPEEQEEEAYPLPFHPLEMSDAALGELFGFQLEGLVDDSRLAPEQIRMLRFLPHGSSQSPSSSKTKTWWKFWQ